MELVRVSIAQVAEKIHLPLAVRKECHMMKVRWRGRDSGVPFVFISFAQDLLLQLFTIVCDDLTHSCSEVLIVLLCKGDRATG